MPIPPFGSPPGTKGAKGDTGDAGGTTNETTSIDNATVADGDYLTVDVDSTTAPAADLEVQVTFS